MLRGLPAQRSPNLHNANPGRIGQHDDTMFRCPRHAPAIAGRGERAAGYGAAGMARPSERERQAAISAS